MTPDQQDLLQALAYLYLRHGQNRRALTLALLVGRAAPEHVGVLRLLAFAFIANDAPEEALEIIDRLERADFAAGANRMHHLLRARALLHAGRRVEARAVFRQFVDARKRERAGEDGQDDILIDEADRPSVSQAETEYLIAAGNATSAGLDAASDESAPR
jgi:hypothetical protein